jgi:Tfp pilus assembly protein PilZ
VSHANRRSYPRTLRRVQVRFSIDGEEKVRHGFTKNLSLTGALVTTADPPRRGSVVRMEMVGKERTSIVYGRVVHAHRMPPELRRFAESAMGVHFLQTAELIAPFLPEKATGVRPLGVSPDAAGDGAAKPAAASEQTYSLSFEKPSDFLTVFHRDLVNGGLFVATSRPAKLDETVVVVLHLPGGEEKRLENVKARVVQVVEPRQVAGGRTAGGMGLELLDPDGVLERLTPVVEALQGDMFRR